MNWDELKGDWKIATGKLKAKWGKLTDDDMTQINGKREELSGRLQKQYGQSKEEAEKQIDSFLKAL
ncbi:MAG: CsbD family protein [Candidatus Melainabacteria bacterium]|nr:CsbD family protein [Candidatus Melainabacteria bacterium]